MALLPIHKLITTDLSHSTAQSPQALVSKHLNAQYIHAQDLHCAQYYRTVYNGYSPSTMPLRVWSLAQVDVNISHGPFYENYTGCQSDAVSSSRWPHWCSRHWTAWHLHTWLTIATWSAMTFADCVQLSPSRVRYQGQGQGSVIDRLQLLAHVVWNCLLGNPAV